MISKKFCNISIEGLACAVPSKVVLSQELTELFDANSVNRFVAATGIKQRHVTNGKQTGSDLCYVAAKKLMEEKTLSGDDIDALVFVTQFPDYKIPSTAYVLQYRLGIKQDCLVFDVNLGCSAFINGIYFLAGLVESGTINRGLLLVGDVDMEYQNTSDISFAGMFGDAGSACLITKGADSINGMIRSDGSGYKTIWTPKPGARFPQENNGPLFKTMNGEDTFTFTITKVPKLLKEFCNTFEMPIERFDYCVLHQANLMVLQQIAKKLKLDMMKVPVSLDKYGNTDGSSIPVTIVDLCEKLKKGERLNLIASGFGVGLSWGVISLTIATDDILPMIVTDDYYKEDYV